MKFTVTWSQPMRFEAGNFKATGKGVYLIGYRDTATGKRHILYFGQGDIDERLAAHFQNNSNVWRELVPAGRVGYYRYAVGGTEADRLDVELALYNKYGSKSLCNEIRPPGSGRYLAVAVDEVYP